MWCHANRPSRLSSRLWAGGWLLLFPGVGFAAQNAIAMSLIDDPLGIVAILIFILAYLAVMAEEFTHLRKSKPVLIAAGIIWLLVAISYHALGDQHTARAILEHNLLEYVQLLLFLLAAMTFINTLEERRVFDVLRARLVTMGLSFRAVFWVTGLVAFFLSPIADNLTTALVMGAVVMAVGKGQNRFVALACINVVVAANAGGAFSPFGDITTLMVWQAGMLPFTDFFRLFVPSLVNWVIPALVMSFAVPALKPPPLTEQVTLKRGAITVMLMFIGTIAAAVSFHNFYHLPPMLGMMTGLGALKLYGYLIRQRELSSDTRPKQFPVEGPEFMTLEATSPHYSIPVKPLHKPFDIFISMKRAEWDTLMFFYGVILCVGGLSAFGYLAWLSRLVYVDLDPTFANVMIGLLSAIIDNIPVMFAVLTMQPSMAEGQWLLVTLTAGVGGSLLSIGSAAGVALMGQARGVYTFFVHLKWMPVIALGYIASILVHQWLNAGLF